MEHRWNGVTTLQFAKICRGLITSGMALEHLQHIVPGDDLTKAEMLEVFAASYSREDIRINKTEAAKVVDRTLNTQFPERNAALWRAAGYAAPPSVADMIREMSRHKFRLLATAA